MKQHMHAGTRCIILCCFVAQALSFCLCTKDTFPTQTAIRNPLSSYTKKKGQVDANFHSMKIGGIQQSRQISTHFHLSPLSNDSTLALSTIILSSGLGMLSKRLKVLGGGAGTIISLASAAMLSNFGLFGLSIPTSHRFYDICWSKLLPASLALVIIGSDTEQQQRTQQSPSKNNDINLQREILGACGIPFVIGSIGSILGCILSAIIMVQSAKSGSSMIGMNSFEAAVAAGCLCASYIGGSVNFFATANIISCQMASVFPSGSKAMISDLISAMAAADLLVMALYFVGLSAMLSVKKLGLIFPGRQWSGAEGRSELDDVNDKIDTSGQRIRKNRLVGSTALAIMLVLSIVEASNSFEKYTSHLVPGLGCAAVAMIAMFVNTVLESTAAKAQRGTSQMARFVSDFSNDLKQIGGPMSDLCFMALFAAIGVSANLKKAMARGGSTLVFALLALLVHFLTLGLGSFSVMKTVPKLIRGSKTIFPLALEEILVSSNAAIGGASTAAGFAGSISETQISKGQKRGLITAATFYGVVGYACATTIGVFLTKVLASKLL